MGWAVDPLPAATVAAVRAGSDRMAGAIVAAVGAENPVYAEVLADPAGLGIRLGIETAISSFLDAVERGEPPTGATQELWRRLGEAEFQAGRPLEALQSAFRTGARAAWRAAAELAADVGITAPAVVGLAEGIFVYSDELAADVVEGYRRRESDVAGERQRRRRRLAALLLDEAGHDPETIDRAAELAGWPLPRSVAVLAVPDDAAAAVARRLDADVLAGGGWLVIGDPRGPGRMEALRRALLDADVPAALGASVAPADGAQSLRWARAALALAARGVLPAGHPVCVEDHLGALILHADPLLAERLAEIRLAPLLELAPGERDRLLATLRVWLAHQRHTPAVAGELHVHPQTVRYRLRRLSELLGDALEDPERRFELELAVRCDSAGLAPRERLGR